MKSPALMVASLLTMVFNPGPTAKASNIGLDFSLTAPSRPSSPAQTKALPSPPDPQTALPPLPMPAKAAHPPIAASILPTPPTVYIGGDDLAMAATTTARGVTAIPPPPSAAIAQKPAVSPIEKPGPIALQFNLDNPPVAHTPPPSNPEDDDTAQAQAPISSSSIFQGGVDSLVAKAIGSAEGTRTPEGHRTSAYYGHIDPGNRAWNLGTFSYQHGAPSPEEADERQLKRLQAQTQHLDQQANAHGLKLTLAEKLNGIDLANQAPRAALGRGGYLEWLSEAHRLGMTDSDAILWSRTRSFLNPDTQRWNAPGLGNTVSSISRDQERRMRAIARAMDMHQSQPAPVMATKPEMALSQPQPRASQATSASPSKPKAEAADIIFSVSLQPSATDPQTPTSGSRPATPPLANQAPVSPASSPAIRLESSSTSASTVWRSSRLDDRAKQTIVKDNPVEFPSFPSRPPTHPPFSEQTRLPSPPSQLEVKTDPSLIAQGERTNHEAIDPFLVQDLPH